jgi:sec-independent protein translocase protein TatC
MKDRSIPIAEHLLELRKRLTWSAASVLICTGVAFAFHEQILVLLMKPAQGFTDIPTGQPIYTDLTEFIGIAMKASLLVGLFASLPFVLFQMVLFVAPGLSPTERRYLYTLLPVTLIMFVAGAAFGYRILFPPAVKFLLSFGSDVATPYIRIGNYVNLMISLLFWMGVMFETPVVLFFLSKIGVVTPSFLARQRRWALVVAFILGAVITPTFDPVNQTFVAVPIFVLYEVGIWMAKLARLGRKDKSAELDLDTPGR